MLFLLTVLLSCGNTNKATRGNSSVILNDNAIKASLKDALPKRKSEIETLNFNKKEEVDRILDELKVNTLLNGNKEAKMIVDNIKKAVLDLCPDKKDKINSLDLTTQKGFEQLFAIWQEGIVIKFKNELDEMKNEREMLKNEQEEAIKRVDRIEEALKLKNNSN